VHPPAGTTGEAVRAPAGAPLVVLLGLSAAFLALQVALTDYGDAPGAATGWWWLVVGCLLLVAVGRRRSRLARGTAVVSALVGVVVYSTTAVGDPHAALLALTFLGQALPLLTAPVRRHVQADRCRGSAASPPPAPAP